MTQGELKLLYDILEEDLKALNILKKIYQELKINLVI